MRGPSRRPAPWLGGLLGRNSSTGRSPINSDSSGSGSGTGRIDPAGQLFPAAGGPAPGPARRSGWRCGRRGRRHWAGRVRRGEGFGGRCRRWGRGRVGCRPRGRFRRYRHDLGRRCAGRLVRRRRLGLAGSARGSGLRRSRRGAGGVLTRGRPRHGARGPRATDERDGHRRRFATFDAGDQTPHELGDRRPPRPRPRSPCPRPALRRHAAPRSRRSRAPSWIASTSGSAWR